MNTSNIIRIIPILAFCLLIHSCQDEFLEVSNPNRVTEEQLKTPSGIRQLEIGMFQKIANVYNYDYQLMISHLPGEYEFRETTGEGPWHKGAWDFNASPSSNNFVRSIYGSFYAAHPNANMLITFLENKEGTVDQLPEREYNLILGAAYFIRAYSHLVLLQTFGRPFDGSDEWGIVINDKIVFTKDDYEKARSKPSEVYAFIESDLKKAKNILLKSSELLPEELGRPTRGAATAFLGKIYVLTGQFQKAADEFALFLSENPDKKLLPYYGDNFHGVSDNGPESIFEVQFGDLTPTNRWGAGAASNHYQIYTGGHGMGRDNVAVPDQIMAGFDERDIRFSETVYSSGPTRTYIFHGDTIAIRDTLFFLNPPARVRRSAKNTYTPKKYISNRRSASNAGGLGKDASDENQVIMRVAEVYFLYAEALAELGRIDEAREYLNRVIRRARGYWYYEESPFDYVGDDKNEFMQLLMEEKRKEFIGEQIRWWDVLRWGIVEQEVARIPSRVWSDRGQAFPIPAKEIATNPFMIQNPGY